MSAYGRIWEYNGEQTSVLALTEQYVRVEDDDVTNHSVIILGKCTFIRASVGGSNDMEPQN